MKINWMVLSFGFVFWLEKANFHDWRIMPSNDLEIIQDGILLLIFALAFKRNIAA